MVHDIPGVPCDVSGGPKLWHGPHGHTVACGEATLLLDLGPTEFCDPSSHRLEMETV